MKAKGNYARFTRYELNDNLGVKLQINGEL